MNDQKQPVRIAVNVMRARLTIVGFNLAIVTFQLNTLSSLPGGVRVASLDRVLHFDADISLLLAMALSVAAMVLFIVATEFDSVGLVTHWSIIIGDFCMYLALAQSINGFFAPMAETLREALLSFPERATAGRALMGAVLLTGGLGWFLAMYLGPCVSLLRSPFGRAANLRLAAVYGLLLVAVSAVSALAATFERSADAIGLSSFLVVFAKPLQW